MHAHHTVNFMHYMQSTEGSHTILVWLLVGLVAGYLTGRIMRGRGFGPIVDVFVGVVGAILGGFLMVNLGYAGSGGFIYTVFVAVLGACLLTVLLRLLTAGRFRNF
ncbi:MAG: GlsB/YeaQ/YmgE family stress response membrane protein [Acidobacteriota bacterium]